MAFNFFQKFIGRRASQQNSVTKKTERARSAPQYSSPQESEDTDVRGDTSRGADRPVLTKGKSDYASIAELLPHISEKATGTTYTFRVSSHANKIMVKKAVEDRYNVKVSRVHTINTHGRTRRRGNVLGRQPGYKKALITLQKNYSIDEL
ncbi:MAG TPA: 50S ribosomal protein L23 [Candidatus Paceibacterota bacterium]